MTTITETIRRVRKAVDDRPTAVQATLNIETVKTLLDAAERAERLRALLEKANYTYLGSEYVACLEPAAIQEALSPQQPEGEKS